MKSQELMVKILGQLDLMYGNVIDQQEVRKAIEHVIYDYNITDKETLPATVNDINDKIYIYVTSKKIDGLSKLTLQNYVRRLSLFSKIVNKKINDITTMDIRMYLAERSKCGVKNSTIATETNILRSFFNWLQDEEYIERNPMKKINTIKVEKRVREALTRKEFELLREGALTLRQKALLEFLYSTGCRLDEVVKVNKSDIDWNTLSLQVIGKGNKERTVFINARAQVHLRKYILSRLDSSEALFVAGKKPYRRLGRRSIEREINIIQEQSDLDKNIYPHLIRHTISTHLLNSGMSITALQQILGHEDPATTQIYAKLSNIEIASEYRKYS